MSYNLFLDDFRRPEDAFNHMHLPIYNLEDWVTVRNYYAFILVIEGKGIPDVVSFDHDLNDFDYENPNNFDYEIENREKTGYHCAKWLIDYCLDNEKELPKRIIVHSMNPYGSLNIKSLFESFYKVHGQPVSHAANPILLNPSFRF